MQQTHSRGPNASYSLPLTAYLLVTFCSAWLIWLPLVIAEYTGFVMPVPPIVLIVLGSFMPTLIALLFSWRYSGVNELRDRKSVV